MHPKYLPAYVVATAGCCHTRHRLPYSLIKCHWDEWFAKLAASRMCNRINLRYGNCISARFLVALWTQSFMISDLNIWQVMPAAMSTCCGSHEGFHPQSSSNVTDLNVNMFQIEWRKEFHAEAKVGLWKSKVIIFCKVRIWAVRCGLLLVLPGRKYGTWKVVTVWNELISEMLIFYLMAARVQFLGARGYFSFILPFLATEPAELPALSTSQPANQPVPHRCGRIEPAEEWHWTWDEIFQM